MSLITVAQYATEILAVGLVIRLLWLRDKKESVYSIFVAFLTTQLLEALGYFACVRWRGHVDYRIVWFSCTAILAICSLLLVYALAKAILAELPGILRFSRTLLKVVFPAAVLLVFSTAKSEYLLSKSRSSLLDKLSSVLYVADKGVALASVITLLVILAFILWFPVRMSRNLAVFSVGLVVYFACKSGLEIVSIYWSPQASTQNVLDMCLSALVIICFAYWVTFIGPKGQTVEVRMGHGWQPQEQEKLMAQLEALNGALLRSGSQLRSSQQFPL